MQINSMYENIYSNIRSARKYKRIRSKCTRKNGPPRKGQDTAEPPVANSFILSWNHMYKKIENIISILKKEQTGYN